jgi:vitamin B12 transporter
MLKYFLLSSAALTALMGPAIAQTAVDDETVIVSATRIPTPAIQVGSSVTLIDGAAIEARQQRTLPDVLQDVPGLAVVQTGGAGGQTSLFMRGSNANHTKVMVDGIDIADPSNPNGAADISKFLTGDIARVEVLRGPQSGLYGSDAIGGVVVITTRAGEGPTTLTGSLEGGSFDSFNQTASLSGSDGNFHFAANVDHVHAGATPVTPLNLLLPGEKRNDDYYDGINASTKLGLDISGNFDLGLVARYGDALSRITGDAFSLTTFTSYPSPTQTRLDTQQYETRGTAHWKLSGFDQTLGLAYGSTATSDRDPNNGSFPSSGNRIKLDWQGIADLGDGETLVAGAETARDAMHLPIKAGVTTNAGYAELQSAPAVEIAGGHVFNSVSVRYDDNSRFGGHTTWHLAPAFVVDGTRLKASIGSGFKAPSLEQLFESFPAFGFSANPNLKPETSLGYDAGFEQTLGVVRGGATWFHNDIKNLITNNASFTTDINVGKAKTQGVEAFLAWKLDEALSLRADYTYTDAVDQTTHLALIRRPRNKASLTADWQALPTLGLDATLLYVGPQIDGNRDFSIPRLKLSGYSVMNVAANWNVDDHFTLFGRIENAFDTSYQSPDGFLRPGLGAYAGIKASL